MSLPTVARGTQAWAGFSVADHQMVHKDPENFLVQKSFGLKQNVNWTPIPVLTPGMQEPINYRVEGLHSVTGNIITPLYPEQTAKLLKSIFGASTPTTITSGVYNHKFLGQDTVPSIPLCFTLYEDLSCMNLVGCYPTSCDISIEKSNPVELTMNFEGMHGYDQKGTSGTSTGQSAISFPATLVVGVSDQIKLAVDGATATEITIAAAAYADGVTLAAAINDAIASTAALLDSYRRPLVACYVNSLNKLVFYSGTKGITSSIAWTDGTHDANTILGQGTPVESAGAAANSKPTESTVQPFIATKVRALLGGSGGTEIPGVEKIKISVHNGMGLENTVGYNFAHQPVINKRREVKVSLDVAFTDTAMLTKFLANTTVNIYVLLETGVIIGATAYKYQAEIYLASCKIVKIPLPNVSGQQYIKQTIELQAFYDVTHQDIEIDLQNSLATI